MTSNNGSDYVVVARRYRPQQFAELVGQEHVARALEGAIQSGRVGHAYLFTGARGVGKTSTARILAKALNCVNGPTPHPCGECDSCQSIAAGHDVDVLEIDGASNRGIDEIRQLRQNAGIRPSRSRFKIYIIDEVHMLTKEAFNALLKTLEEPPEHVKFIFATTEPEKLPVTVISRCQRFDFSGIRSDSIVGRLRQIVDAENVAADDAALALLARRAGGSMRDSQSLLEQLLSFGGTRISVADVHRMLGTASGSRMTSMGQAIAARDAAGALAELDAALAEGADAGQVLEQLLGYVRDLMVAAVDGKSELLQIEPSEIPELVQTAKQLGLPTILAMLQILDQTQSRVRLSTSSRTLAEMALVRLCALENLSSLSSLISQFAAGNVVLESVPAGQAPAPPAVAETAKKNDSPVADAAQAAPAASQAGSPVENLSESQAEEAPLPPDQGHEAPEPPESGPASTAGAATAAELESDSAERTGELLDASRVRDLWTQAISELGVTLSEHASRCRELAILAPNHLAVRFPERYSLSKAFCELSENAGQVVEALAKLTGKRFRIDYHVDPPTGTPAANAAPTRRRTPQDLVRAYSTNELVVKASQLFGARLTSVDEPSQISPSQASIVP